MNRRLAFLQATFSIVSLAAVVWWASQQGEPQLPDSFDAIAEVVIAVLVYGIATVARGERWQQILRRSDIQTKRSDSYALTTIGYMGNNVLPARAGEILRMFLLAPRTQAASRREILGTIVAERVLDLMALLMLFLALGYTLLGQVNMPGTTLEVIAGICVGLVIAFALIMVLGQRLSFVMRLKAFIKPMAGATRQLVSWHGLGLLVLSVMIWALEAGVYLSAADAINLHFDLLDSLYVVAFTNLFALIPAAPGYVGTFDAAVVFASKAIGAAGSATVSYLLLLRFVLFVPITVVGLIFLVVRYGGWSRLRAARVEASSA
jgi:uncharacterized membrane protein YbhN (UPF0104 family)